MNEELSKEIEETFKEKPTAELLDIWSKNDRREWSDEAFEAIHRLLDERGEDIPEQDAPVMPEEPPWTAEPLSGWKKPLTWLLVVIHFGAGVMFLWLFAAHGAFTILPALLSLGIAVNLVLRRNKWLTVALCGLIILLNMDFYSSTFPLIIMPGAEGIRLGMIAIVLIEAATICVLVFPNKTTSKIGQK
ncbi:hypothetical protein ACFLRT_04050 [Acidobacteriota bacterium]